MASSGHPNEPSSEPSEWLRCLDCGHVWNDLNSDHEVCDCFHRLGRRRSERLSTIQVQTHFSTVTELANLVAAQERDDRFGHRAWSIPFDDERAYRDVPAPNITRLRRDLASRGVAELIRVDRAISAAIIASVS